MRAGIPPRVTSKKTIGFPSVASAMVVAVQCLAAAGVVRILQGQMTLALCGVCRRRMVRSSYPEHSRGQRVECSEDLAGGQKCGLDWNARPAASGGMCKITSQRMLSAGVRFHLQTGMSASAFALDDDSRG
jgi:hypothetical protein